MKNRRLGHALVRIQVRYEPDIVTARQKARRISELLGFDQQDQARLATAVSEIARNVFQYTSGGGLDFYFSLERSPQTLFISVTGIGEKISELRAAFETGHVSNDGIGGGLQSAKKLMDSFEIDVSSANEPTLVFGKEVDKKAPALASTDLVRIAGQLLLRQPENPFEEIQIQNRDLLVALDELQKNKSEMAELNRELAETNRGVVALYAELDEKASSLQRANEVKTSFLSNMTHEFRTPLSSIISLTRLLLNRIDGDLTVEQEKQVTYIRKSSESLLELVNDLLDLAKVEAGKIRVLTSDFDIDDLLGGLRGMFRPIVAEHPAVEFRVDWDPSIPRFFTDQAKLSQILRNLVSNALKYTEHGSVVVYAKMADDKRVEFSVSDTGIGIKPEHLNTVFDDFSQVESKLQKRVKGTGLGLPLSRKLARLLGGDLEVTSDVGQGSIFTAVIPLRYVGRDEEVLFTHSEPQKEIERGEGSANFRILLIDDDETSRYILKGLISSELRADFIEADTGRRGIELAQQRHLDAIFLDLTMPGLEGTEVLKLLKDDRQTKEIPVIVNTAKLLTEEEHRRLNRDAAAVLSKDRTNEQEAVRSLREALQSAGFDYQIGHELSQ